MATGTAAATKAKGSKGPRKMSEDHKKALAEGREHTRVVNAYLNALDEHKPKRGRQRTQETVQKQLNKVMQDIVTAKPAERLQLVQQRRDLEDALGRFKTVTDTSASEAEFVKVAKAFSERRGISYGAWREVGVSAEVLKKAGIGRGMS